MLTLGRTTSIPALLTKIIFLGLVLGLAVAIVPALISMRSWTMLAILVITVIAVFTIYTTRHCVPAKYLFPGTFFLVLFLLVPVIYTIQISTTNFGDGTRASKSETVSSIVSASVVRDDSLPTYTMSIGVSRHGDTTDDYVLLLVNSTTGRTYLGTTDRLSLMPTAQVTVKKGRIVAAKGYRILTAEQVNNAGDAITGMSVPVNAGKGVAIHTSGISSAYTGTENLVYDSSADTITDRSTGDVYSPRMVNGRYLFVDPQGRAVSQRSWLSSVGLANYTSLFTDSSIRGQLLTTSLWTLFFAVFSVAGTFLAGLLIALLFDEPRMIGRKVYRSLMVVPYAVPTFIGFLIWSTFFNKDFGLVNQLTGLHLDWFGNASLAKIAVRTANLWAGIPYMFLISTGALQSLPADVVEAARVDGARPIRLFFQIKMPLLLVSVAPLLVSSFAFNFNNYNAIALMTQGGPFSSDGSLFGGTDILISGIYRLAFGGSGARFGLAAAVSVLLFFITALMAIIQFRYTRKLEEIL
ncbi:ABC transporter permease subunit [Bifidobacterium mongoliense]|uniref:Maltose/maltodextrin transport system permease protein n=1 Tax=Bifidobacterium mongoliense DSM 21395 TaxID=1437603 RepID=A0A087C7M3_9BIFI|nr:ABC transporter permease subunit [Bifidobacterium mongoliense]KFI79273.1 permease of ABC-type sugar transporter [Bifidobacterium mongoliense DSM 21395]